MIPETNKKRFMKMTIYIRKHLIVKERTVGISKQSVVRRVSLVKCEYQQIVRNIF